jgi:hypothetical protein
VLATPAGVRVVALDGSCVNCQFGVATAPAFAPSGTDVSFVSSGQLREDGIDGLAEQIVPMSRVSDAVWSAMGELAVVRAGQVLVGQPGSLRPLGSGSAPAWAPGGSELAFVRRGWVLTTDLRGATRRVVRGTAPGFAPDGKAIAYIGSGHQLRILSLQTHRSRAVGHIKGLSVDWQQVHVTRAVCTAPSGSTTVTRSAEAVVTQRSAPGPVAVQDGGADSFAYMGCLRGDGHERLLEKFTYNNLDGATSVSIGSIGGDYAALVNHFDDAHYGQTWDTVAEFDLRTGATANLGLGTVRCESSAQYAGYDCGFIGRILVADDGAYAIHTQGGISCSNGSTAQTCSIETINSNDRSGIRTLDEVFSQPDANTGPHLTGLTLSGTTLSWQHDGTPRSAQLQ